MAGYWPATYWPATYWPVRFWPTVLPPAPPLAFKAELAKWLSALLGVPVHSWRRPQAEALPAITYSVVDGDTPPLLAGPGGYAWATIQFDAWAEDPEAAELLQDRLYRVLFGFHATVGAATNVQATNRKHNPAPLDDPPEGSDAPVAYRDSYSWWIRWDLPGP